MLTAASRCSQVVEWDEVKFDVRLMQRVPCTQLRVNPSLATATPSCCSPVCLLMRRRGRVAHADLAAAQAPRSRRAPVRRRGQWNRSLQPFPPATCSRPIPPRCSGLALIIESDFYATDAGRAHFADQLTSIRYCVQEVSGPVLTFLPAPPLLSHRTRSRPSPCRVQETCNFDVLYACAATTQTGATRVLEREGRALPLRAACAGTSRRRTTTFRTTAAKNLRPKRNIRTAMNHGARPFATSNPRFRCQPRTPGLSLAAMVKNNPQNKTPAKLANQARHNQRRRDARAATAHAKFTVPREGACEEIVHSMVAGMINRLLWRKRRNESRKSDPKANERAAAGHTRLRDEALSLGITQRELASRRKAEKAKVEPTWYNPRARHKERMQTEEDYSARVRCSRRLREFVRLTNGTKAAGTMELVGCSQKELVAHLKKTLATRQESDGREH